MPEYDFENLTNLFKFDEKKKPDFNILDMDFSEITSITSPSIWGDVSIVDPKPSQYDKVEIYEPKADELARKESVEAKQAQSLVSFPYTPSGETIRATTDKDAPMADKFKFSNLIPFKREQTEADKREDARLSYLRGKEFAKTLESMKGKVKVDKDYKEPETFSGQLAEGFKAGLKTLKATPGYVAEVIGRQTGSIEMLQWGQKYGDKKIAELVLDDTLSRPADMKEFLKGGYKDPRLYGRYIGETLPSIVSMMTFSTIGGLTGGPSGAAAGAYGSIYAMEQANAYKGMIDNGVAPDKAGPASSVYGVIATALENAIGYSPAKIGSKLAGREVQKEVITNYQKYLLKKLPELPAKVLKKSTEEGVEEVAQGLTEDLINKYFDENHEVLKNIPENFFAGTIGSLPFAGTEATSKNIKELYEAAKRVQVQPGLSIKDVGAPIEPETKKKKIVKMEDIKRPVDTIIKPDNIKAGDRINIISESVNEAGVVEKVERGLIDNEGLVKKVTKDKEKVYVKMDGIRAPLELAKEDEATAVFREKKITPPTVRSLGIERPQSELITKSENTLLKSQIRAEARAVKKAAPTIRKQLKDRILMDIKERRGRVSLVKGAIMELSKTIPLSQRGKLLAIMKNAKTFRDLDKAKVYIEKISDVSTKKSLVRAVYNLLKKTKVKKQQRKPVGKYTAEIQKTLDLFREVMTMSKADAESMISDNIERNKGVEIPDDLALQNRILRMGAGILEMSNDELSALYNVVSQIERTGVLTNALRKFNRETEVQGWREDAINTVTGGKGITPGTETVGVQEQYAKHPETWKEAYSLAKHKLQTMGKTFVGWQDIMDMMSSNDKGTKPGESWLNNFAETLDQENEYSSSLKENTVELRKMFSETYDIETDRQMIDKMREDTEVISLGVFENNIGEVFELKMSRAQARKRWMELQDPTLESAFKKGMFYTEEIVEAIDNLLTTKDKEFVGEQLDFYQKFYKKINDVYRDIYGVDLPFNPLYSPITRGDITRDTGDAFSSFNQDIALRRSVSKGALKTRVKNKKLIETKSDVQVLQAHVAEMEHFIAWANKVKDLNAVFGDPKVMTAIEQEYGKGMNAIVQNFLINFSRGGIEMATNFNWMDRVRVRFTQGVLAAKPSIAVKQVVSFIAYADAIPVKDYMKGELDFWSSPIENYKFLKENSKLLQARGENMERDIKSANNSDAFKAYRKKQSFINTLMLNIKLGDQAAIVIGGWSVYKYHYDKAKSEGKTEPEAKEIGIRKFEIVTKTTQQSAALSDLSTWQRNPLLKLFTMFLSTPNQYFRKELGAIRNTLSGRGSKAQHLKTIFIFHFLLPMMFQFVSDFGRWDEKEQKRAMILGSLNGLFIIGDGLDYLIRSGLGMRKFAMEQPYMSTFDDLSKPIDFLVSDVFGKDPVTMEDFLKAMEGMMDATGKATGLPTGYAWDSGEGVLGLLYGKMTKGLGQLAGWSEYAIDEKIKNKKVKFKGGEGDEFGGVDLGEMDLEGLDLGDMDLGDIDLGDFDLSNFDFDEIDLDDMNF